MKSIVVLLLFFVQVALYGQDTVYARAVIKKLTSSHFLGRGYVKNGVNKAASYLSRELKTIGLSTFGHSSSQAYAFGVNTFPGSMWVSINGKLLTPGKHYLIYPSAQTLSKRCQLVKKDSVTYRATEGGKELPVTVILKKKLTYTVATSTSPFTTVELLQDSFPNELHHLDIAFENKYIPNFKCQNVCAYVKGTQQPDSFLVFTAHYDHLGAMGKKTFFPGANDNASGVSVLLNLAKYYQQHPTKYSVAFLFFSGEEAGLLGSKYYTEHPLFPLSAIKFLTNLDLLGTGNDGLMVVNATEFKAQFETLNQINQRQNTMMPIKQRGKAANSDHYWFTEKGVPCFFIYTMGGIAAYHDVYDVERTLPLTKYVDVCRLLIAFYAAL